MLVLALEFSRGCTAHAWAGTLAPAHASRTVKEQNPGRGLRGVSGPHAGAAT